ncbi:hypothetical protein IE53DRAFT_194351 [Violaceomyces palustris]|uniref:Uncharacterized protein n=1 Tax=Violaceomyces palustris TaxID=1673888 RepID=A0ACD0NRX3_9BASI|nr:hypothetical protein IE53DRAFT_194351 [Violaceomyces palustris]
MQKRVQAAKVGGRLTLMIFLLDSGLFPRFNPEASARAFSPFQENVQAVKASVSRIAASFMESTALPSYSPCFLLAGRENGMNEEAREQEERKENDLVKHCDAEGL